MAHQDFKQLIVSNKRKTVVLIIVFCSFFPLVTALLVTLTLTFS
jgi:hypothetical protein